MPALLGPIHTAVLAVIMQAEPVTKISILTNLIVSHVLAWAF